MFEEVKTQWKFLKIENGKLIQYSRPCTDVSFDNIENSITKEYKFNSDVSGELLDRIRERFIMENSSNGEEEILLDILISSSLVRNVDDIGNLLLKINKGLREPVKILIPNPMIDQIGIIKIIIERKEYLTLQFKINEDPNNIAKKLDDVIKFRLRVRESKGAYGRKNWCLPRRAATFKIFINDECKYTSDRMSHNKWWNDCQEIVLDCFKKAKLLPSLPEPISQPPAPIPPKDLGNGIWEYPDWSLIKFMTGRIAFKREGKKIDECFEFNNRSRGEYNELIGYYNLNEFKYKVTFSAGHPKKLEVDNNIFRYLDFGLAFRRLKNTIKNSHRIEKVRNFFSDINNSNDVRKLITFLGYSKSFYFTNLFELQMPQVPVKVFLEPRGFGGNDGSHDASFIYQIQREGHYYVIWESLEPNKATYIFRFSDLAKCNKGIVDFAAFLKSEAYSGRDNLRENGYSSVNSNQISRVFHNPEEKNDVAWLNAIKAKIGS